jgi:hypothetical protein
VDTLYTTVVSIYAIKPYGVVEVQHHFFLNSALDGNLQLQTPAASPPGKQHQVNHLIGWVVSTAGVDSFEKSLLCLPEIKSRSVDRLARLYTDRAIPAPIFYILVRAKE